MVTTPSLPKFKTITTPDKMLINNNKTIIDQPLVCVDGYLLSCQYSGDSCTPMHGLKLEELLESFREELGQFGKDIPSSCSTPTMSDKPPVSPTTKSSRSRSFSKQLFRQHSGDGSRVRRSLFSDPEFLGISSKLEKTSRNSFILPISNTPKKPVSNENELTQSDNVSKKRAAELTNQVEWVEEYGSDYINTETVHDCSELLALLNILMKSSTAALVTLKINSQTEITVTYQFLKKFKQDYMVVKINKSFCMLMKTF